MDSRERFHAVMNYQPTDRAILLMPSYTGFPDTVRRWRGEGFKQSDLDCYPVDQWTWVDELFFPHPPFEKKVVEEEERHVLYINHEGILMREFKDNPMSSMPQFVRFPVETREDFRAFARERLQPDLSKRLGPDWVSQLKVWRAKPGPLILMANRWGGFFGPLRNLLGVQQLCMAFYTDPDFIEEMMDTIADFTIALVDKVLDTIEIDMFAFWEDMCFKMGPLIDPDLVRRYMLPRYKRVVEFLHRRGVKWIGLDSDGRVDALLPIWLEAGINFHFPFEVNSGMDVVALRRQYGRDLRMFGGMDKRPLARDRKAIDREVERIRPLLAEGGFVASLDHTVPPDVPYDNFRYYLDRMAEAVMSD